MCAALRKRERKESPLASFFRLDQEVAVQRRDRARVLVLPSLGADVAHAPAVLGDLRAIDRSRGDAAAPGRFREDLRVLAQLEGGKVKPLYPRIG